MALVAAVIMVVGAVVVRARLSSEQVAIPGGGGTPIEEGSSSPQTEGPLTLSCPSELESVCTGVEPATGERSVQVTIEPAADTAETLATSTIDNPAGPQAWLVPAPWVEVTTALRDPAAGPVVEPSTTEVLARSPLVLAAWEDRAVALDAACGRPLDWPCLGEQAGRSWADDLGQDGASGTVRPAHQAPGVGATGLLVLGQAVAGYSGTADLGAQALDQPAFAGWFADLQDAVPSGVPGTGSLTTAMLTRGRAAFDVAGVTEAEAVGLLGRAGGGRELPVLRYPEPLATADTLLVAYAGSGGADRLEQELGGPLRERLAAAGWRVDGGAPDGAPGDAPTTLPEDDGLPGGGFLVALRNRYQEVAR